MMVGDHMCAYGAHIAPTCNDPQRKRERERERERERVVASQNP